MDKGSKVSDVIARLLPRYVDSLREFVSIPSLARDEEACDQAAAWTQARIERLGGQARVVRTAGRPVVLGRIPGQHDRTLLCYNHYDVQPVEPLSQWRGNPWVLREEAGRLIGRGTADNKGQLLSRLFAIEVWQELGGLPLSVELFVEGEEEAGSPHVAAVVRDNRDWFRADGCLWESGYRDERGRYQVGLGAKGLLYLELRAAGAAMDLHSVWGGMAPNPLWELVWALGSLYRPPDEITIPGLCDPVRPPDEEEKRILREMDFPEQSRREHWQTEFLASRSGFDLQRRQRFWPQVNICGLAGGHAGPGPKTVIPATATAKLDVRLVPWQQPAQALQAVTDRLRTAGFAGDIEVLAAEPPAYASPSSELVQAMMAACEEHCGYRPPLLLGGEGSGPMHPFTDELGLPVANGFGVGHAGSLPHAPEENIRLDDVADGIGLLVRFLELFGRGISPRAEDLSPPNA